MSEVISISLREARARLRSGVMERDEWADAWLRRIEKLQPELNAFVSFDARAFREAMGRPGSGALAQTPIAVKDNILAIGAPTTCASKILHGFVSPRDATAVARLRSAGAVIAGKTNLDEFAMGSSTEQSAFGPTRNPWDRDRVPGGSSGGSAAAVASRMVPVALGSDTGGSVRQPAALCGIVGLKPTWGRVSRSGLVAFASSLDQIGILATSVEDAADVLQVISGVDAADSTSSAHPVPDFSALLSRDVRGLRFGVIREVLQSLNEPVRSNFEAALEVLRGGGASIVDVTVPSIVHSIAVYYVIANAEASANLARYDGVRYGRRGGGSTVREMYESSRGEGFGDEVKRRILLGTFVLSSGYYDAYYGRAQAVRALMREDFGRAFTDCDFLLGPTVPEPAFRIGEKSSDPLSMYLSDVFTVPANLLGIPAIAMPSGFSSEGLPLSLQIMGPHFSEDRMLGAAAFFERATGYGALLPPQA